MSWTQDEVDYLVANKDHLTGTQLAKELNKTRNAIMGKLHRMELRKSSPIGSNTKNFKSFKKKKLKKAKVIYMSDVKNGVSLLDRKMSSECGFLLNKTTCCGKPIVMNSYCEEHAHLCYTAQKWQGKYVRERV